MSTTTAPPTVPNHHAHHPPFRGAMGLAAALSMSVGRDGDAEIAMELASVGPDDRIVDIGSGPGAAARLAAKSAASVIGVEPAAVMRRVARALTRKDDVVSYVEGTAEDLPVDDGAATVVWSLATIHHWRDVEDGLSEARRVLAPGGRFVGIERRVDPGAAGLASHGWTDDQAAAFADLCTAAGFVDVHVERRSTGHRNLICVVARRP